jgi:hypothetical protein
MLNQAPDGNDRQITAATAESAGLTVIPGKAELLAPLADVQAGEDKPGEPKRETSFLGEFMRLACGSAGFLMGGPAGTALGSAVGELAGDIFTERTSMILGRAFLHPKGVTMKQILLIVAAVTAVIPGGVGAGAAELPTYELMGFPISPHQFSVVGSVHVRERSPVATITLNGMPASPHQIAVLSRRRAVAATVTPAAKAGFPAR